MENRLNDKISQDLSYLPNLKSLEVNIYGQISYETHRPSKHTITGTGFAYLSKLRNI